MQHLRVIAQAPHPVGSIAHDCVRDYIVTNLSKLKLDPLIQTSEVRLPMSQDVVKVQNIMARLEGEGPDEGAVMLMAHYDSVPPSYGASDNGAGVVVLLETLRALMSGPKLKKDIIFLFSDGEEIGLLGSSAFHRQHKWATEVELILNFEARGSSGPVYMFETSNNNGSLIMEFARAASHPFANSLSQIVYENLPNETDLAVFKQAGYLCLNFAFVDSTHNYHTKNDVLEVIDEGSIQHHGLYAMALTRHFGNLKLKDFQAEDVIYFDLVGKIVITYSYNMSYMLTNCVLFLFVVILIYRLKAKECSLRGVVLGIITFILSVVSIVIITACIHQALILKYTLSDLIEVDSLYFIAFILLACSVTSSIYLYLGKWVKMDDLYMGSLLIHLIALAVVTVYWTAASYLLAWPLLFGILGMASKYLYRRSKASERIQFGSIYLSILPTMVLLLWSTICVFQGITLFHFTVLMMFISLCIGFFIPLLNLMSGPYKWLLPAVLMLTSAITLTIAIAKVKHD